MKKFFYAILFMALVFTSCEKDSASSIEEATEGQGEVTFAISDFDQEVVERTKFGQTNNERSTTAYLFLYSSTGELMSADRISGYIPYTPLALSKYLSTGSYYAQVVAFTSGYATVGGYDYWGSSDSVSLWPRPTTDSTNVFWQEHWYSYVEYYYYNSYYPERFSSREVRFQNNYVGDYFYNKVAFTVTGNTSVSIPVSRATGRLEINFTDIKLATEYPVNDRGYCNQAYVRIKFENMPYGFNLPSEGYAKPSDDNYYYLSLQEWDRLKSKPLVINCMPTSTSLPPKITLEFSDEFNASKDDRAAYNDYFPDATIWHKREITGFQVYKNKITKLTGGAFNQTDFGITVDTNWDDIVEGGF